MDVYAPRDTKKACGCVMAHSVSEDTVIKTHGYKIEFFRCNHDVTTYGFLITHGEERLMYVSDTNDIDIFFNGVTHLMIECNYDYETLRCNKSSPQCVLIRVENTHMDILKTFNYISQLNQSILKEIHLIHMSSTNINETIIRRYITHSHVDYYMGNKKLTTIVT
jgi:hypothetical protein